MYNNVLQNIDNIAIWPMISIVIFFLFFICLLWWVFTVDKKFIEYMKDLPIGPRQDETQDRQTIPPVQEGSSTERKSFSQNRRI